jgi:hypothetical protein
MRELADERIGKNFEGRTTPNSWRAPRKPIDNIFPSVFQERRNFLLDCYATGEKHGRRL